MYETIPCRLACPNVYKRPLSDAIRVNTAVQDRLHFGHHTIRKCGCLETTTKKLVHNCQILIVSVSHLIAV